MIMKKIKVLVVDDSASVRKVITEILNADPRIEVIGNAADPYEAASKIAVEVPDVITLDIEMPRMDGLTFLSKLMAQHPIPVIVISSVTGEGSELGIRALKLGAREIITKPQALEGELFEEYRIRITDAIKACSLAGASLVKAGRRLSRELAEEKTAGKEPASFTMQPPAKKVILIGASTGGTEVISKLLKNLRNDLPGILIVQHMPGEFTGAFAKRLNRESKLLVKEAENGDVVRNGCVYVANGFNHMKLVKEEGFYKCRLELGAFVNHHRPSVDVLFKSAARYPGSGITAVLLTGMGSDGANGLLELKNAGCTTFAQDEDSSVIFGMPKEAIRLGAATKIVNPDQLISWLNSNF